MEHLTNKKEFKSINDFKNRDEFLGYIKPQQKEVKHPYVVGSKTRRPYVVGYGCDGSTDANIHYVAQKMVKALGWDYAKIYNKAYEWQKREPAKWLEGDLGEEKDEALKNKKVKDTTIIPKNTTIQNVLDDLYDINNRSVVEELENRFERAGISLNTKLSGLVTKHLE